MTLFRLPPLFDFVRHARLSIRLCVAALSISSGTLAYAQMPVAPEVSAKAWMLLDITSGQVLAAKDTDTVVEPASLTKLMTAYVVFDALRAKRIDLKQKLSVSERAWKMPGSRMFIDPKMTVAVDDLIKGMVVQSGNDATVALAEGVGGTVERFVGLMNEQGQRFGLQNTAYKNPEGLTEAGHFTTVRDLSVVAQRLLTDFPEFLPYYAIKKYRLEGTPAANDTNRNLLLFRDPSVDGLKTGHTEAAGYCLVATAKRSFPNLGLGNAAGDRRLLSVLVGAASENARAIESQKLLNWGYTAFEAIKLFDAGQAVVTPRVWKGTANEVKLGRPQPMVVAVPAGSAAKVNTQVVRPDPLVAPLSKGQTVGKLVVRMGDAPLAEIALVALDDVAQASWLGRTWDAVRLWIK